MMKNLSAIFKELQINEIPTSFFSKLEKMKNKHWHECALDIACDVTFKVTSLITVCWLPLTYWIHCLDGLLGSESPFIQTFLFIRLKAIQLNDMPVTKRVIWRRRSPPY